MRGYPPIPRPFPPPPAPPPPSPAAVLAAENELKREWYRNRAEYHGDMAVAYLENHANDWFAHRAVEEAKEAAHYANLVIR